ncbi:MAG: hypothetical protein ACFB20_13220 [Opitutales bacterium]
MTLSQFISSFSELMARLVGHSQGESFFWPVAGAGLGVFFVLSWVLARTAFGNDTSMGTSLMVFGIQLGLGLVLAAVAGPLAHEHVANPSWDLPIVLAAGIGGCVLFGMVLNRIFLGMKFTATVFVLGLALSLSWVAMAGARMSVDLFEAGAANVQVNKERKDSRIPKR